MTYIVSYTRTGFYLYTKYRKTYLTILWLDDYGLSSHFNPLLGQVIPRVNLSHMLCVKNLLSTSHWCTTVWHHLIVRFSIAVQSSIFVKFYYWFLNFSDWLSSQKFWVRTMHLKWETFKTFPELSNAERPELFDWILTCWQQPSGGVSAPFAELTANKSDVESFIFA